MSNLIKYVYNFTNRLFNRLRYRKNGAKDILIYSDKGVSPYSALGLFIRTNALLKKSPYNIKLVNADYVKNAAWESNTALFIMPGGRARPYYDSLGTVWKVDNVPQGKMREISEIGIGNKRIYHFVTQNGGKFFGVCAGAYYASGITIFEEGGFLEVIDEGPLKFFSGIAEGPAYGLGKFSYRKKSGVRLAEISWDRTEEKKEQIGHAYYNGGCFFHKATKFDGYQVLARYNDISEKPAAVIECKLDKGQAILSGVHFETSHQFFSLFPVKKLPFYDGLKKNKSFQMYSLQEILMRLDIKVDDQNQIAPKSLLKPHK